MERVGFERVARIFLRNVLERTRPGYFDGQRHEKHEDRGDARLDMHAMEKEPVKCFVNDVERGEEQERGLNECGKIFELAVAVGMPLVGWLIRDAHGEESDDGGEQVQAGVQSFGENAQAS